MKHIIPRGVLHAHKNNIPDHLDLGKKGIPVVQVKQGGELEKVAEIEHEELILNKETAAKIEELVYKYLKSKDDRIALILGKLVRREILLFTEDKTNKLITDKFKKQVEKNEQKIKS